MLNIKYKRTSRLLLQPGFFFKQVELPKRRMPAELIITD